MGALTRHSGVTVLPQTAGSDFQQFTQSVDLNLNISMI